MDNTELIHHGIKGQKWGVRRYQNKDGTRTAAGKKREKALNADSQVKAQRKAEVKSRRTMIDDEARAMSDKELQQKIKRLQLEKQYKDLREADTSPGRKYVSDVLSSAGKKALTVAAAGAISYAIKVAITKEFNPAEAARYVAANPNKKK